MRRTKVCGIMRDAIHSIGVASFNSDVHGLDYSARPSKIHAAETDHKKQGRRCDPRRPCFLVTHNNFTDPVVSPSAHPRDEWSGSLHCLLTRPAAEEPSHPGSDVLRLQIRSPIRPACD